MTQPLIVFAHGNSFPACTYRVMLEAIRSRGFRVEAVDKFGHDPRYPVTDNWPHLVQQLTDFATPLAAQNGPVFLVGHSLGGILSMMVAAKHPELVRGVVLHAGKARPLDGDDVRGEREGQVLKECGLARAGGADDCEAAISLEWASQQVPNTKRGVF